MVLRNTIVQGAPMSMVQGARTWLFDKIDDLHLLPTRYLDTNFTLDRQILNLYNDIIVSFMHWALFQGGLQKWISNSLLYRPKIIQTSPVWSI